MADSISWIATVATVIAASMTAANLGSRITGYGFCVFLVGSLSWLAAGIMTDQPALMWTNAVLTVLNLFGTWRWLGRQVRIEEGGLAASSASERTPGESLFPVSLLTRAPVEGRDGQTFGNCVDAMTGCETGRLHYVVASVGGVGGVGETLRQIWWQDARMDSGRLVVGTQSLSRFPEIEDDEWPVR